MLWMAGDQAEIVTRRAVGLAGFSWKIRARRGRLLSRDVAVASAVRGG
jgi:hypothetical protein